MDKRETPKARRPLPTPGAAPARPNTPVNVMGSVSSPIPASSFYGTQTSQNPPPLPTRPRNVGSSLTTFIPPSEQPPTYGSNSYNNPPGFREPELVAETDEDDQIPDLEPETGSQHWSNKVDSTPYDSTVWGNPESSASGWDPISTSVNDWNIGGGFDPVNYAPISKSTEVAIDGRSLEEELHWWDAAERAQSARPGPGMLGPVLAELLHNPDHTLFSVSVTSPNIQMPGPAPTPSTSAPKPDQGKSQLAASGSASLPVPTSSPQAPAQPPPPPQPTEDDVRTAVPHPNAYYCPKENGWVILSWKSSSVAPPLARSFEKTPHHPLPDQNRRKRTGSCLGDDEQPFGQSNKTHHFHKYEKAVDAHKLTPPLKRDEWEVIEAVKAKRRAGTIVLDDLDLEKMKSQSTDEPMDDPEEEEEEGRLLDLYVCCQCSFYCVASGMIPGVISRKFFEEFAREKQGNPPPGKTGEQACVTALETIISVLENKLWKGENRMLRISRPGFQSKVGWNANTKRVFEALGFTEEFFESDIALRPPNTDSTTVSGKQSRRKLLRAWVEISAWIVAFRRLHSTALKDAKAYNLSVKIDSAREMYQTAIGAHPDQIPRGNLAGTLLDALRQLDSAWHDLGLTPTTYSPDLLSFAYLAQCRCHPAGTVQYFTHFSNIVKRMQELATCPPQLQELLAMELSRDRFTTEDVAKAAAVLGFGADGTLRVDYEDDIPEDFIEGAWRDCVKRSWRDLDHGTDLQREANEAFRVLAEARGSLKLRKLWEAGKNRLMTPARAYDTLEVPSEVEDTMLITVFTMRLEEQPLQDDKMREALSVIAEIRDSERLRQFLATGMDPGDIVAPTRLDLPRGLNQLGNTCYLNSLLQYFYTIKDLRDAVSPMLKLDTKTLEDEKLSDDDLKRHRVGGRLVTRREIVRSKKFINQLADLFFNLEYADNPAVTPSIELAKLALVTSRDEEEDEADKGGTESSNDTDATLVDDVPSRFPITESSPPPPLSPARSPSSVLGKRPRDGDRQQRLMDIDSPFPESPKDQESFVMVTTPPRSMSPPASSQSSSSKLPEASASTSKVDSDGDVEMHSTTATVKKPPPLPPRKATGVSDSVMMFGKQHDVAECMDNCMFQIETALLRFDGISDSQEDGSSKTSVVKRLFYGKIRQRLTGAEPQSRSSIHEKEDLFSHLPVNVADDGVDIYDGLSGYFDDVVDFEGRKHRMEVSLVDLPPLLQIQLQRVQFNRDTLQPYKSQAYVKFGETIYMDRFMDSANPHKKAQSKSIQGELNGCRERVRMLIEGKDGPYISALEQTSEFLSKVDGVELPDLDDELIVQMNEEQVLVREEIARLRGRIDHLKDELEAIWRDDTEVAYELTSVFIHRGSSPSWGHYFFYSRHLPDAPDSWFKYNDSDVSVVSKDEVLADTTGSTANPYLLVFARKGSEVVDTVKRFDPSFMDS